MVRYSIIALAVLGACSPPSRADFDGQWLASASITLTDGGEVLPYKTLISASHVDATLVLGRICPDLSGGVSAFLDAGHAKWESNVLCMLPSDADAGCYNFAEYRDGVVETDGITLSGRAGGILWLCGRPEVPIKLIIDATRATDVVITGGTH